ncbi:MAG: glycosyltransferase [Chitinophagales bacterium]|nr:glycosyltransferase [Chitinophagales bacterium]
MIDKANIKVSVCVVTYNQEKYLGECLQSLVEQSVDFEYEIIIGDDASTDGTESLVQSFQQRYPNLITLVRHERNIGATANYISVHSMARGTYVCHMDGDDVAYPGKLSKQVAVLDGNKDCVLVWHMVNIFNDTGAVSKVLHRYLPDILNVNLITRSDLFRYGMLGAHSSTMYRRSSVPDFGLIKGEVLDYFVVGLILTTGNASRIEEVLGGYRVNVSASSASKNKSLYFKGSLIRDLYCEHLEFFLDSEGGESFKQDIFLNALFNLFVDVRFLRPSSWRFFLLAKRAFSFNGLRDVVGYFKAAVKLRK